MKAATEDHSTAKESTATATSASKADSDLMVAIRAIDDESRPNAKDKKV